MITRIPATLYRGGTSKGPLILARDLPADRKTLDAVLLAAMGSPHKRQIDGIGGAETLTSKIAVVSKSARAGHDVDYLFVQVNPESDIVDYSIQLRKHAVGGRSVRDRNGPGQSAGSGNTRHHFQYQHKLHNRSHFAYPGRRGHV